MFCCNTRSWAPRNYKKGCFLTAHKILNNTYRLRFNVMDVINVKDERLWKTRFIFEEILCRRLCETFCFIVFRRKSWRTCFDRYVLTSCSWTFGESTETKRGCKEDDLKHRALCRGSSHYLLHTQTMGAFPSVKVGATTHHQPHNLKITIAHCLLNSSV